jgi:hypothetical protein
MLKPITEEEVQAIPDKEKIAAALEFLKQQQALFPADAHRLDAVVALLS